MDQNSCAVTSALEAPFVISQLLSKLDPKDDIDFGREMQRVKNEENVLNLGLVKQGSKLAISRQKGYLQRHRRSPISKSAKSVG